MEFSFANGSKFEKSLQPFEGVIPNYERRLKETDSDYVREFISNSLS